MPKVFRAMKADEDGHPAVGPRDLGVRFAPDEPADITPDERGTVSPGTGGMSVVPELLALPDSRIPKRLRHLVPSARGSNTVSVWSMGEGPFADGPLADKLALRRDPEDPATHGFVEPDAAMPLAAYRDGLHATRDLWREDEG